MPYEMRHLSSTSLLILPRHGYLNYILYVASDSHLWGQGMVPARQHLRETPAAPQSERSLRSAASGISNAYGSSIPGRFAAKLKEPHSSLGTKIIHLQIFKIFLCKNPPP